MGKSRKSWGKWERLAVVQKSDDLTGKGVDTGKAESTGEPTAPKTGELVPQDHGGSLRWGGTSKGGPGRTPDELRALFRQPLAKLLPVVERIAEAVDVEEVTCPHCDEKVEVPSYRKDGDKLKAVDLLARYGIGTKQEVDIKGRVTLVADTGTLSE